jgi:hypothetical protein
MLRATGRYEDVGVGLAVGWAVPGPSDGGAVGVGENALPTDGGAEPGERGTPVVAPPGAEPGERGTPVVAPPGVGMLSDVEGSGERLGTGVADPAPGPDGTGAGLELVDVANPTLL